MSNFDFEIKFDEPQELDGPIVESGSQFPSYGLYKLEAVKLVTLFAPGEKLTLPDLIINGEPYQSLMAMKEGGKTKVFVFSLTGINTKTGEPYTAVDLFCNAPIYYVSAKGDPDPEQKTGFKTQYFPKEQFPYLELNKEQEEYYKDNGQTKISDWVNLAYPAIKNSLTDEQFNRLKGPGLWVKANSTVYQLKTNYNKLRDDGKPKQYRSAYRHDFTVFENEAAMNAAKSKEVVLGNGVVYPAGWGDKVEGMLDYIAGVITADNINATSIAEWKLTGSEHVHAILKEAVERKDAIPPEKAAIMAAIDAFEYVPF